MSHPTSTSAGEVLRVSSMPSLTGSSLLRSPYDHKIPVLSLFLEPIRQVYLKKSIKLSAEALEIVKDTQSLMDPKLVRDFQIRIDE
jgi:hypothetical protein